LLIDAPDRLGGPPLVIGCIGSGHVVERDDDVDFEPFVAGSVHDDHWAGLPAPIVDLATTEELGDALQRALRGAQSNAR
jgi:hypothetical protein